MTVDELPTPALLIDRQRLVRNLDRMQARAEANDVALRPHIKTHKCVEIARLQKERGARGITVATVREAEVFVEAGFDDVRIAYPMVGRERHERILRLMERAQVSFCVDTAGGMKQASVFYAEHGREVDVLMEVDVGHGRCGVWWESGEALDLARLIHDQPGLHLSGILTHAGQAYRGPNEGETRDEALRRVSGHERDRMLSLAARLHDAGTPGVEPGAFTISIGSTPSLAAFENRSEAGFAITEIRPGNYVFYDAIQVGLGAAALDDCALTVLATVVSKHSDSADTERIYVDAGKKVLTTDVGALTDGYGTVLREPSSREPLPEARITGLSEEHGWVEVEGTAPFAVGDRLEIIPNHACVTVGTQDALYLVEEGEVAAKWTVDARGHATARV